MQRIPNSLSHTVWLHTTINSYEDSSGFEAFHTLMDSKLKTAQGAPYELIVVCNQQLWESELGDTLRSVLLAPIPYLNEREPLFNVMQFPESGFKGTVVDYRNILKVLVDPSLAAASASRPTTSRGFSAGRGDASGTDRRHLRNMSRSIVRSWCKPSKGPSATARSLSPTSSIRRNPASSFEKSSAWR